MSNPNIKPAARAPIMAVINPVSQAAATVTSGWVSAAEFDNILAVLMVGALGASATVDAKIEQAQGSGGTNAKDLTSYAITTLTKAGTDDNKQVEINVPSSALDAANSYTHVRLSVTVATAACLIAAVLLGFDGRYQPETDATTVDEIVG